MATFLASNRFRKMFGLDLPFLKVRGKKIIYRSTGFDVRLKSKHMEVNPYHPFRYGFDLDVDEDMQKRYLDYLREYVDVFITQDPEMQEFVPEARIVPRSFPLDEWPHPGIERTDRPLIVHAPSNGIIKGTKFILRALDELDEEGYKFDVKLIENMPHAEAKGWYQKADICIDQLLIGWYGVLTIECLALGKPVIVYIREDLYDSFHPRIPIENANPDNIKDKLRLIISDYDRRQELAAQARDFVRKVHDAPMVASTLLGIYHEVHAQPNKIPRGHADLEYFLLQYRQLETAGLTTRPKDFLKRKASFLDNFNEARIRRSGYPLRASDPYVLWSSDLALPTRFRVWGG